MCSLGTQMNYTATVSQNIVIAAAKTNDSDNTLNESNPNRELLVVDNLSITNTDHDPYVLDTHEFADGVDFGFALPSNVPKRNSKSPNDKYKHQCRVEEYIMQGIEDLSIANQNEDFAETEI